MPLKEDEQVRDTLRALFILEVLLTTYAHLGVVVELINLVSVAESEHFLVFSFLVRVVSLELFKLLGVLTILEKVGVDLGCFFH